MTSISQLRADGLVAVVGAGPAGLALARLLQGRGLRVTVLERDASATARPQGGSLDLRPDSGGRAIRAAGLEAAFAGVAREDAKGFKALDARGRPFPGAGEESREDAGPEIDRGDLRRLLLDSLAPGTVAWGRRVAGVAPEPDGRWRVEVDDGEAVVADLVVGADGINSQVRARLTPARPRYVGHTMLAANIRRDLWRGSPLAELLGEGAVMFAGGRKTVFVQRCAKDVILLYYSLPVPEAWPAGEGFGLEDAAAVLGAVRAAYRDWSPEVLAMLTAVDGPFHRWPLSVMPPDHRWPSRPGLTLLGDASHGMPPFTGKGVNLALLDALELADALTGQGTAGDPHADLGAAVAGFEARMQDRARAEIGACLAVGRDHYGIEVDFAAADTA